MHTTITNTCTGIAFTMRLVRNGDTYGLRHCLTCTTGPLVEFYDTRYPFDVLPTGEVMGQFVSRYYLETLLQNADEYESLGGRGLVLDGETSEWRIDPDGMRDAVATLKEWAGVTA